MNWGSKCPICHHEHINYRESCDDNSIRRIVREELERAAKGATDVG